MCSGKRHEGREGGSLITFCEAVYRGGGGGQGEGEEREEREETNWVRWGVHVDFHSIKLIIDVRSYFFTSCMIQGGDVSGGLWLSRQHGVHVALLLCTGPPPTQVRGGGGGGGESRLYISNSKTYAYGVLNENLDK